MSTFVPVVAAVVGGAIAFIGVLIGPGVKARGDLQQWRRERRLDAYAEMTGAASELLIAINRDGGWDIPAVVEACHKVQRAEGRVALLAPKQVTDATWKLYREANEIQSRIGDSGLCDFSRGVPSSPWIEFGFWHFWPAGRSCWKFLDPFGAIRGRP
jgi:hypothetical protein